MLSTIHLRKTLVAFVIVISAAMLEAQQPKNAVSQAPLPAQIGAAKKVFISYADGDTDIAGYSGDADRTYNQFYAAIKSWGHYEIVPAPASADLVFEIGFIHPVSQAHVDGEGKTYKAGGAGDDPQFKLAIRDPKSNVLLWTLSRHIPFALLTSNQNKNFDQTMNYFLDDIKELVGSTTSAVPNASGRWNVFYKTKAGLCLRGCDQACVTRLVTSGTVQVA